MDQKYLAFMPIGFLFQSLPQAELCREHRGHTVSERWNQEQAGGWASARQPRLSPPWSSRHKAIGGAGLELSLGHHELTITPASPRLLCLLGSFQGSFAALGSSDPVLARELHEQVALKGRWKVDLLPKTQADRAFCPQPCFLPRRRRRHLSGALVAIS